MSANQAPVFVYSVILPHPTEPRLLLLSDEAGIYSLPSWTSATRHYWQSTNHINHFVQEQWSISTFTLRCVGDYNDPRPAHYAYLYELENLSPDQPPPLNGKWVNREEFEQLKLVQPQFYEPLKSWFRESETGYPATRRAWARKGWYTQTVGWLHQELIKHKIEATSKVEQVRTWERSCVLRVETSQGAFYLKAVPPMFRREIAVSQVMSEQLPSNFPQFLSLNPDANWMLMADFGGQFLEENPQLERRELALIQLARLQIASITKIGELLEGGCPDCRLSKLAEKIEAFLAELQPYTEVRWSPLSSEQVEQLQARKADFVAMCEKLAAFNLPATLEHGDLWPNNVCDRGEQGFLYYDWSDSSISHPFFTPQFFLDEECLDELDRAAYPDAADQLREAYLTSWQKYLPIEQLREAFELAQRLAPLHQTIYYHRYILPHLEARWEMENMVPFYLKKLL